ncbi:hypothetical protein K492DRAFT_212097 [Lichtheimia hyalospora FSU 10163]|nr:hypothetical protein K492DRAFT_212097 [Lichtheimia hyalospora FSU 10163]
MDKYLERQSSGRDDGSNVDDNKRRYIEVQNCEEHTEFDEKVTAGPIISSGVDMIIDAADNPRSFSERIEGHLTDIGKETGKTIWNQVKDKEISCS